MRIDLLLSVMCTGQRFSRFCALSLLLLALSASNVFAQETVIHGVVQTSEGDRVAGVVVRVEMVGMAMVITTASGEFQFRPPSSLLKPGDAVRFQVEGWTIIEPADGRVFIPRDPEQAIVIVVRPPKSPIQFELDESLASELRSATELTLNGTEVRLEESGGVSGVAFLGDKPPEDGLHVLRTAKQKMLVWLQEKKLAQFKHPYQTSYAILVAIDDYERRKDPRHRGRTGFGQLGKMVANAEALKLAILKLGFPRENIISMYDEKAESGAIDNVLKSFLAGGLRSDADRVFFYFGGHGGSHNDEGLLVTYDYDRNLPTTTSLLMGDLTGHYSRNIEAKSVLIALDACSSGLAIGMLGSNTPDRSALASVRALSVIQNDTRSRARNVLLAGTGDQKAVYDNGGIFTQALIRGLGGEADLNHDGVIEFKELAVFVEDEVAISASLNNVEQKVGSYKLTSGGAQGEVVFILKEENE